jgi:DNA mismatch endonuclease, patch repair protein
MSRVRNRDTAPERQLRRMLHRSGYRFRLHPQDLPGSPDIVLPRFRAAIFVHGCFWHGHGCPRGARPTTNREFWDSKLDRNVERDKEAQDALESDEWSVLTVWECELKEPAKVMERARTFLQECEANQE